MISSKDIKAFGIIVWELSRDTVTKFLDDSATLLGAGIAFFSLFSVAPLLVLGIVISGLVFGEKAARGQIVEEIARFTTPDVAAAIQEMIAASADLEQGIWATIVSVALLLFGGHMIFAQLQRALNMMWGVPIAEMGFRDFIRDRLLSFMMVLLVGFLSLVLIAVTAVVNLFDAFLGELVPGWTLVLWIADAVLSIGGVTVLAALLFKLLPDVEIRWRDVFIGAFVSSCLLYVGKLLIGLYMTHASVTSTYGAAGSVVAFLLWVYYSAQIFLLGAEFTQVYAHRFGPGIRTGTGDKGEEAANSATLGGRERQPA